MVLLKSQYMIKEGKKEKEQIIAKEETERMDKPLVET